MNRIEITKDEETGIETIHYLVRIDDNQPKEYINPKPFTICGAWIREKQRPCLLVAGTKTSHVGWGRCYRHGGVTQSPLSQRNQKKTILAGEVNYPGLQEEVSRLAEQKDVFDLRDEIFTIEAIAKLVMEKAEDLEDLVRVVPLLERATRIVQRLHEIEVGRRLVIDVHNINLIIENVVDVISRHVTDQYTRNLIAKDLSSMRIGSGFPRPEPRLIEGKVIGDSEDI